MKKLTIILLAAAVLASCDDADVAKGNVSKAAKNFEIARRIVFINGITDNYLLEIRGRCAINADVHDDQLEVTCKVPDGYKVHFLGLSDNVTYLVEQIDAKAVSVNHYRVTFKPQTILPSIDLRGGGDYVGPTINRGKQ